MNLLQAGFLGLIQGVAEFLPISSSGHLAIFQNLFHMNDLGEVDAFYNVLLHLATLISVLFVYWKDVRAIVLEFLTMVHIRKLPQGQASDPVSRRMIFFIIIGTLPLLAAMVLKDQVESLNNNLFFIAGALAVTGTILFLSDRFALGNKQIRNATIVDALIVGIGQMFAVVPGLSRSGTTIATGLYRGFDRTFAVKFSFLLSIPAILGANIVTLAEAIGEGIRWSMMPAYLFGMVIAAVSGYLSIRLLNKIAASKSFGVFSYYCWGAGIVTLFLALIS